MLHRFRSEYSIHILFGKIRNASFLYHLDDNICTSHKFNRLNSDLSGDIIWAEQMVKLYAVAYPDDDYEIIHEICKPNDSVWVDINFLDHIKSMALI